jgi:DNA (cytosine-5)-methyltransferase 1
MASEADLCVAYALQGNLIGRQAHNGPRGSGVKENISYTLTATDTPAVAAPLPIPIQDKATRHKGGGSSRNGDGAGNGLGVGNPGDPAPTITSGDHHAVAAQNPTRAEYVVRRLTPTECERAQGFEDGWTAVGADGKEISDARRYQMLGNSLAIPCVEFVLGGIAPRMRETGEEGEKTV